MMLLCSLASIVNIIPQEHVMARVPSTAAETRREATRLITVSEVAEKLGVSTRLVWRMSASKPGFPKPVKVGDRTTRWKLHEVESYLHNLTA